MLFTDLHLAANKALTESLVAEAHRLGFSDPAGTHG
jgi:hypothetical protein